MRILIWAVLLLAGIVYLKINTPLQAPAIDLREQVVLPTKEPDYETKPLYSLIVFGESGISRHWLVMDGETLYVDRNGNGDLTDPEDRILFDPVASKSLRTMKDGEYSSFRIFKISDLEGHDFSFNFWVLNEDYTPPADENALIKNWRRDRNKNGWRNATLYRQPKVESASFGGQIPVVLCFDAAKTQVSYINGPKTFVLKQPSREEKWSLQNENVFSVKVGSLGLGPVASDLEVASVLVLEEIPTHLHPVAEFRFPSKDPSNPIKLTVELNRRC